MKLRWSLRLLTILAVIGISCELTLAPQRGLLRESGKGEVLSSRFPHWPWALVDGCSFFYRDVFQPSDWMRLSGVLSQADECGTETWRVRHQGNVSIKVADSVVFQDSSHTPTDVPFHEATRLVEFDVSWTDHHVPFELTVSKAIQRIKGRGRVHVELERKNAVGRWSSLPTARLYPNIPSRSAVRLANALSWIGRVMRLVLLGLFARWAVLSLIRAYRRSPEPLALAAVAALVAFAVRLIFVLQRMETDSSFWAISLQGDPYIHFARMVIADGGKPWGSIYSPGNIWWMVLLTSVLGPSIVAATLANTLAASLGISALALATRRLFGTTMGWVVALVAAFYPPLVFYHSTVQIAPMGTALLMFLLLSVVLLFESWTAKGALATGILIGLSALFRPTALIFLPVLIIAFLRGRKESHQGNPAENKAEKTTPLRVSWKHRAALSFILLVGATAVVAPQTVLNRSAGYPVLIANNTSLNIIIGNNQDATGGYSTADAFSEAIAWVTKTDAGVSDFVLREIRTVPGRLFLLQLRKLGRFVSPDEHPNVLNYSAQGLKQSAWLRLLNGISKPKISFGDRKIEIPWLSMSSLCWLAITGMALVFRRSSPKWPAEQRPASRILAIMLALYVAATVAAFVNGRIRIPTVALILPFAVFGIRATFLVLVRPSVWTVVPVLSGLLVAGSVWCSTHGPLERFHEHLPDSATAVDLNLGAGLHVAGFEEVSAIREAGGFVYVRLYWLISSTTTNDLTADVTLVDPESNAILVKRTLKLGTVSPPKVGTKTWPAGSIVSETLYFKVTKTMPADAVLQVTLVPTDGVEPLAPVVVTPIKLVD